MMDDIIKKFNIFRSEDEKEWNNFAKHYLKFNYRLRNSKGDDDGRDHKGNHLWNKSQIDNLIRQRETENEQSVYLKFSPTLFGYKDSSQLNKKADEIKGNLMGWTDYGYPIGILKQQTLSSKENVVVELKVPKGSNFKSLNKNTMILPRNAAIAIDNVSVQNTDGTERIKIKATLADETKIYVTDKMKDTINTKQLEINTWIKNYFNKDKIDPIVSLEPSKSVHSIGYLFSAEERIKKAFRTIPKDILEKIIYQKDQKGENLNIHFKTTTWPGGKGSTGKYEPKNHTIYLGYDYIYDYENAKSKEITSHSHEHGIIHELGHALDDYMSTHMPDHYNKLDEIIKKEINNLTEATTHDGYGRTNGKEFFAEVFANIYSNDEGRIDAINQEAPLAVKFIKEGIQTIKRDIHHQSTHSLKEKIQRAISNCSKNDKFKDQSVNQTRTLVSSDRAQSIPGDIDELTSLNKKIKYSKLNCRKGSYEILNSQKTR